MRSLFVGSNKPVASRFHAHAERSNGSRRYGNSRAIRRARLDIASGQLAGRHPAASRRGWAGPPGNTADGIERDPVMGD
ncbi:MAG: hypothetical protein ACKO6E_09365 [Planctomycetota bacterium]